MRIIYFTDIHHAFKNLETALSQTEASLYLIAGDLVSRAFFTYQTAWRFMALQQALGKYRSRLGSQDTLYKIAQHLSTQTQIPLSDQASEYLRLCQKAEAYLLKSYARLDKICGRFSDKAIFVLPGNYDMDLDQTILKGRNLHRKCIERHGWRIAGYGGAKTRTPGIPDHLQVGYEVGQPAQGAQSAAQDFLQRARPDILVVHEPPYGYLDQIPGYGNAGSHGIRAFVEQAHVKLVLSGHYHEHWGAAWADGTWFLNPSNFGKTMGISKVRAGGYFMDLVLSHKSVKVATLRQLENRRIYDILDFELAYNRIEPLILDEKRYARLGGKVPKTWHIKPIRQLQRIKSFFLTYETPETLALMDELRGIYREIQKQGMEVAFDLLGSVSFGMAEGGSDMDLVVYMRSRDCVLDAEDTCGVPRPLAAVFKGLEQRHLSIEVCDSLDLDRIKQAIQDETMDDGQLQRFIFYRLVCRPVNLRLIKRVENLLLQKETFRREMEKGLEDYLDILVSSVRHVSSFEKYKARLRERGVPLAPDVEDAIRHYLRG